jgi:tetratricopeptide (TPR) repeat protein
MIQAVRRSRGVWLVLGICVAPLAWGQNDTESPAPLPASETGRISLVEEMSRQDELYWQRSMAKVRELTEQTRAAMAANDYQQALRLADSALQTVEANRKYADPVAKYERAHAAAVELQYEVNDAYDEYQREVAAREREEVIERRQARIAEQEAQKALKLEQLFGEVETLKKQQRYAEAADVLREILAIEPENAKARHSLEWAEDFHSYNYQADAAGLRDVNRVRALTNARSALDPIDNPISLPEDWVELHNRRTIDQPQDDQALRRALDKSLDQPVDSLRIPESSFELVLDFLKETFGINISADWRALEEQTDVTRDTIIDEIEVSGTTLRTLIQIIMDRASPIDRLGLDFRPGELVIVPFDSLTVYPRMYDVLPYIFRARPQIDSDSQTGGTGGGGGGSDIFGDEQDQEGDELREDLELFEELFRTIIGPDNFPVDASILSIPASYLLVTQTYENHKKIEHFLRTSPGPFAGPGGSGKWQAAFEARFLTVTNNFLEEIGIDLDFVFNSGTAGFDPTGAIDPFTGSRVLMPRASSRAGFIPSTPALGTPVPQSIPNQPYGNAAFVPAAGGVGPQIGNVTPIPVQSSTVDLTNPVNLSTGITGSFSDITAPAISIAGSFLDNLQVDFLIRATQADRRSSIVSAPRVTVANGESGAITFGRTQNFVSNLSATPDSNVVNTQTQTIDSGTSLILSNVVISPDRKYVTTFINLNQDGDPILNAFDVSTAPRQTLILPDQEINRIITQASIPDGGTILLGGIKRVAEIEIDAGVPILSKIPIIKRAFTNTSTIKDTQTLLILIKTNIIIPQEAEQEAFPILGGRGNELVGR